MPTPMWVYAEIASRYGIDPTDDAAVDRFFIETLPACSASEQCEIFDELLRRDGDLVHPRSDRVSTSGIHNRAHHEDPVQFAANPTPKLPSLLLLDTSASMEGERIQSLSAGLQTLKEEITADKAAGIQTEIAVVTFDSSARVVQDFISAKDFVPPRLRTGGATAMGAGIMRAIDTIESRKIHYRDLGVPYHKPWLFMITDGSATDNIKPASNRLKAAVRNSALSFWAVGVGDANMKELRNLSPDRPPRMLTDLRFREMFQWMSGSLQRISHSRVSESVRLPPSTAWSTT